MVLRLKGEREWAEVMQQWEEGGVQKSYDGVVSHKAIKGLFIRLPLVLLATTESDPRGPSPSHNEVIDCECALRKALFVCLLSGINLYFTNSNPNVFGAQQHSTLRESCP